MAVPAAVFAAVAFAGCGTTVIDADKAEELIVDNISGGEVKPESASCPDDVEAKKGETFECTIAFEDGSEGKATIHIKSDDGDITFAPADFKPPE